MDALLAYNVVVDDCFKFSITMLLNSTIMLVMVLHYASICSYASILLLCSKLCQHNSPRPNQGRSKLFQILILVYLVLSSCIFLLLVYVTDILQASMVQDIHEAVIQLEAEAQTRLLIEYPLS